MRTLSSADLLSVWERGLALSSPGRALTLLATACPETSPEALARLPIGERDARLLAVREATFGPDLTSVTACPQCGEALELAFTTSDIRAVPQAEAGEAPEEAPLVLTLCYADYAVRFRLPNSADLLALEDLIDVEDSRQALLARCLLAAERSGEPVTAKELPPVIQQAIAARMADADPQADVQLACVCPQCGAQWRAPFDIVGFFWIEIHAWAKRLLREVHSLASSYGWREADILAMSPTRRQLYLEMILE